MKQDLKNKKIAIVCDWIKDWGGAELVLSHMLEIFPQADIYTSIFYQKNNPLFQNYEVLPYGREGVTDKPKIFTSFIQKIPILGKSHKLALTLRPLAFEGFDLSSYDVVISSTSAESKGIITKPQCLHICYCHTPTRYFWSHYHEYLNMMEFGVLNPLAKWLMPKLIGPLRKWDFIAAQRPDYFVANSKNTAKRIEKYYKREAIVIYPGIDTSEFPESSHKTPLSILSGKERGNCDSLSPLEGESWREVSKREQFYLVVGRCIPYKKFDLLVEAFNQNGKKLICVTNTDNKLYRKLKNISNPNIEWKLGISRDETQELFASAKAFVFPPEEDFGLVPLEAQAYGTPVIAYEKGGALETVISPHNTSLNSLLSGEMQSQNTATGLFFMEQTSESLNDAIEQFETMEFDSELIKKHAQNFSKACFQEELIRFIEEKLLVLSKET
ncbi:glycosyltransferase [Candidatus Gracilibacteria bacterium]|nr:glycosyltransferase [Candidatus Gracilibacteria bacterium]